MKKDKAAPKKEEQTPEEWAAAQASADTLPVDIELARKELQRLRAENERLRSGTQSIVAAVQGVFTHERFSLEVPKRPRADRRKRKPEAALLHLSDLQLGKRTRTYDIVEAARLMRRIGELTLSFVESKRSERPVDRIAVVLGGDVVEGEDIFPHQPHEIDVPLLHQAVRDGPHMIAELLLTLLAEIPKVEVYSVPGNHGRAGRLHNPRTNWDTVTAEVLRTMFVGPPGHERKDFQGRLSFHIADDFYEVIPFWDWGVLAVHGHQIKGGFGGFPFYGTGKKMGGWIRAIPEPWDYLIYGHFHTFGELTINGQMWLCNGSTESNNEFAREMIASQNDPVQRLMFFGPEKGYVNSFPLYLEEERLPMRRRFGG